MHIADITAVGKNSQIHLDHPDLNIETYLMLGVDNRIYILHDEPFQKALAWLEYNSEKKQLNFVMEDGDIRYLGVPVEKKFSQFLFVIVVFLG